MYDLTQLPHILHSHLVSAVPIRMKGRIIFHKYHPYNPYPEYQYRPKHLDRMLHYSFQRKNQHQHHYKQLQNIRQNYSRIL